MSTVDIEAQLKQLSIKIPESPNNVSTQSDNQYLLHYCKQNILYCFLYFGWIILTIWNIHALVLETNTNLTIWYYLLVTTCLGTLMLNTYLLYYTTEHKAWLYLLYIWNLGAPGTQIWGVITLIKDWKPTNIYVISTTNICVTMVYYVIIFKTHKW